MPIIDNMDTIDEIFQIFCKSDDIASKIHELGFTNTQDFRMVTPYTTEYIKDELGPNIPTTMYNDMQMCFSLVKAVKAVSRNSNFEEVRLPEILKEETLQDVRNNVTEVPSIQKMTNNPRQNSRRKRKIIPKEPFEIPWGSKRRKIKSIRDSKNSTKVPKSQSFKKMPSMNDKVEAEATTSANHKPKIPIKLFNKHVSITFEDEP